jgi:hypothetical protein
MSWEEYSTTEETLALGVADDAPASAHEVGHVAPSGSSGMHAAAGAQRSLGLAFMPPALAPGRRRGSMMDLVRASAAAPQPAALLLLGARGGSLIGGAYGGGGGSGLAAMAAPHLAAAVESLGSPATASLPAANPSASSSSYPREHLHDGAPAVTAVVAMEGIKLPLAVQRPAAIRHAASAACVLGLAAGGHPTAAGVDLPHDVTVPGGAHLASRGTAGNGGRRGGARLLRQGSGDGESGGAGAAGGASLALPTHLAQPKQSGGIEEDRFLGQF